MSSRIPLIPRPFTSFGASRRQVNLAGDCLRDWWEGRAADDDVVNGAIDVAYEFRAEFQEPLRRTVMGLRSMVGTAGAPVIVGQRLKRMPQIVRKLGRFPHMDLSRMQDIGGCRAVLPDQAAVTAVHRRIRKNWDVKHEDDYATDPKVSGYRGVHVVVERMGRLVEVQLRTGSQHDWAEAVERMALRTGHDLKEGTGPDVLLRLFERSAYAVDLTSRGGSMSLEFDEEWKRLLAEAAPYFARREEEV